MNNNINSTQRIDVATVPTVYGIETVSSKTITLLET